MEFRIGARCLDESRGAQGEAGNVLAGTFPCGGTDGERWDWIRLEQEVGWLRSLAPCELQA